MVIPVGPDSYQSGWLILISEVCLLHVPRGQHTVPLCIYRLIARVFAWKNGNWKSVSHLLAWPSAKLMYLKPLCYKKREQNKN